MRAPLTVAALGIVLAACTGIVESPMFHFLTLYALSAPLGLDDQPTAVTQPDRVARTTATRIPAKPASSTRAVATRQAAPVAKPRAPAVTAGSNDDWEEF